MTRVDNLEVRCDRATRELLRDLRDWIGRRIFLGRRSSFLNVCPVATILEVATPLRAAEDEFWLREHGTEALRAMMVGSQSCDHDWLHGSFFGDDLRDWEVDVEVLAGCGGDPPCVRVVAMRCW